MPAKRLPWVKLWPELMERDKVRKLNDSQYRTWTYCLLAGSQQPTRWRFDSLEHAAYVVRRPAKDVKALADMRFLDVRSDGVWIHDAQEYQDSYPSDYEDGQDVNHPRRVRHGPPHANGTLRERSLNTPRTLAEHSANAPPILAEHSSIALESSLETEKGDRDIDGDGEYLPPPTADPSWEAATKIVGQFEHHTWSSQAGPLHTQVQDYLDRLGFLVTREYQVADRGDGRPGRVDLVANRGQTRLAIEIDSATIREKSPVKLRQVRDAVRIVLLRGDPRAVDRPAGVDLIGFLPNAMAEGTQPKNGRATEIDASFQTELEDEFWEAFGTREAVRDAIAVALSHKARRKCTDQRAYLRNWIRKDAEIAAKRRTGSAREPPAVLGPPLCDRCGKPAYVHHKGMCRDCNLEIRAEAARNGAKEEP